MKVVVFGGCGFLGRHIVKELLYHGHDIIVADIEENKSDNASYDFVKCDITQKENVQAVFKDNVDIVYNFAALADLNASINSPVETMNINVTGNLNILEACWRYRIKHFIYASSVYACSNKASFYGISKLCSEKLIEQYQKKYGLNYTILRYGSLYGPTADTSNGIRNILQQALKGKLVHRGTGEEVREYIHVKDAAKLSVKIMTSDEYLNKTFTLTGATRVRQKDLFNMINEMFGDTIEIKYEGKEYDGHYTYTPYSFVPSISNKLMPDSFIDLGQGIVECLEELDSHICQDGY